MVVSRDGRGLSLVIMLAARLSVAGSLALVAGCASEKNPNYVSGPMAQRMAAAPPHKVEMEDDGEPVQAPPVRRMRPEEDDPSQPWSPNYGRGGAASTPQPPLSTRLPKQVDAAVTDQRASTSSLTSLSSTEADALIAQAITAQEMRQQ